MELIKKLALATFIAAIFLVLPFDAMAQNNKKGGPPSWAPAHGYRAKTRQVYFPDHNFYYDVQKGVYIYLNGKNWQVSAKLPSPFAGIDLKVATKIELDLDTDTPQQYNADHLAKYKGKGSQSKGNNGNANGKGNQNNPGKGNKK